MTNIKIVTWNINSVRARIDTLRFFIENNNPDILLLQEIKCSEKEFPEIKGYNNYVIGQKSYNGVAILSKYPITNIKINLDDSKDARYIEGKLNIGNSSIIISSIYVINGQEVGSSFYEDKLKFLDCLYERMKNFYQNHVPYIIGGDFNVTVTDKDVYDPLKWKDHILCSLPERLLINKILNLGFVDATYAFTQEDNYYTWWDYRRSAFLNNHGLRLDYFFTSPFIYDKINLITRYIEERKSDANKQEKPSDHIPVMCSINI